MLLLVASPTKAQWKTILVRDTDQFHSVEFLGSVAVGLGSSDYGFVGGGKNNKIKDLDPTLGTSLTMPVYATVTGGDSNRAEGHFAAVGGGRQNEAHGEYATIPGGYFLDARDYQTVIGVANRQYAPAPLLSNTGNPFSSPTVLPQPDDRVFIIGNGTISGGTTTRSNAFEVSSNGHSIVFDRHGTSGAELYGWDGGTCSNGGTDAINPAFPHKPVIAGATYADNVLYAWADVMPDPQAGSCVNGLPSARPSDPGDHNDVNVLAEFGCRHIQRLSEGVYRITLDINRPDATPIQFSPGASVPSCAWPTGLGGWAGAVQASVVCNVIDRPAQEDGTNRCATIAPTRIFVNNVNGMQLMQFDIHIRNTNCDPIDRSFTFQVTGRPTP